MLIALHKNARTTPAVRAEIAASSETASAGSRVRRKVLREMVFMRVSSRGFSEL